MRKTNLIVLIVILFLMSIVIADDQIRVSCEEGEPLVGVRVSLESGNYVNGLNFMCSSTNGIFSTSSSIGKKDYSNVNFICPSGEVIGISFVRNKLNEEGSIYKIYDLRVTCKIGQEDYNYHTYKFFIKDGVITTERVISRVDNGESSYTDPHLKLNCILPTGDSKGRTFSGITLTDTPELKDNKLFFDNTGWEKICTLASSPAVVPIAAEPVESEVDGQPAAIPQPKNNLPEFSAIDQSGLTFPCADGIDNNGDGTVDCEDESCAGQRGPEVTICPIPVSINSQDIPETCYDGLDNNEDGHVDCDDFQCNEKTYCNQKEICNNQEDDNNDGLIDCADLECEYQLGPEGQICLENEICNNSVDDDGDGNIDAADFECGDATQTFLSPILLIGDSHSVGAYGKELHRLISENSQVQTYACGGAAASNFDKVNYKVCNELRDNNGKSTGPNPAGSLVLINKQSPSNLIMRDFNFETQLSSLRPQLVIISLGTNFLNTEGVNGQRANILSLINKITTNNAKCIWVGAPVTGSAKVHPDEINSALKQIINTQCSLIDAEALTQEDREHLIPPSAVHFDNDGGKSWAKKVYYELQKLAGNQNPQFPLSPESISPDYSSPELGYMSESGRADPSGPPESISKSYSVRLTQIDQAWRKVSPYIKGGEYVYDPTTGFVSWDLLYPPPAAPGATQEDSGSSYSLYPIIENEKYDRWFNQYAQEEQVSPALVKAIGSQESAFNPWKISTAGAAGLGQFIFSTANDNSFKDIFPNVHQCCTVVDANEGKYHCKNERAQAGKDIWVPGVYQCSPIKGDPLYDDRFDSERNIHAMARLTKQSFARFPDAATPNDRVKLTIASHNRGSGKIFANVNLVKQAGQPVTWENVKQMMNRNLFKGQNGQSVAEGNYVNPYVERIFEAYQKYQPKSP